MEHDNKKPNHKDQNTPNYGPFYFIMICVIIIYFFQIASSYVFSNRNIQIAFSQFIELVDNNVVDKVQFESDRIIITLADDASPEIVSSILDINTDNSEISSPLTDTTILGGGNNIYYTGIIDYSGLIERLLESGITVDRKLSNTNPVMAFISGWVLPIVVMYLILFIFIRILTRKSGGDSGFGGFGGMMNVGKSKAKLYNLEKNTGITFKDVAGQDEAKESLDEMVDFLRHPDKYHEIGAKQPKGALLVGPPGTGKTLLAKAVAGESSVPFFSLSGSEFVEMFVGVGASRVRDLFQQANKNAPCIIFIDEIDAIGKSRDNQMSGNDEREQTLNQLLAEMDGFDSSKGLVILAATNRPEILDKALLRPGRFDRRIIVEKPDLPGRKSILAVHAAKVKTEPDINLHDIALSTSGATGADLANMINEAALRAIRLGRQTVTQDDLMEAVELVVAGKEKKDRILSEKEKRMVAYHEVGHALASALQKDAQPVQKITIVPRTMGSLGYTMQMPEEERYLMTKNEILAQITTLLAGRAAEEVVFSEMTTGASNDIERASKLARSMVTQYGMSEKFDMMGLESIQNQYLDGRSVSTCSEATGASIDDEVKRIIKECHEKATQLLQDNRKHLTKIAEFLIEKETITGVQFMEILKGTDDESDDESKDNSSDKSDVESKDTSKSNDESEDNSSDKFNVESKDNSSDKSDVESKDTSSDKSDDELDNK